MTTRDEGGGSKIGLKRVTLFMDSSYAVGCGRGEVLSVNISALKIPGGSPGSGLAEQGQPPQNPHTILQITVAECRPTKCGSCY